jgi:serpin B
MRVMLTMMVSICFLSGCRTGGGPSRDAVNLKSTPMSREQGVNNAFGFDLYRSLAASSDFSPNNLFISPTSISTALGLTYLGADGATREEMARLLRVPSDVAQAGSLYKSQLGSLQATKSENGYDLKIANKIWTSPVGFKPSFIDATRQYFDSEAARVDFRDSRARSQAIKDINNWASDNTNARITQIVDQTSIQPNTSAVLANAVYFLGDWVNPFPNDGVPRVGKWLRPDGAEVDVTYMADKMDVKYVGNKRYEAVELPYKASEGESPRVSMVIVLPAEGVGLGALDSLLDTTQWDQMIRSMEDSSGSVMIPKWEVQGDAIKLKQYLVQLGMKTAWIPYDIRQEASSANFSGMTQDRGKVYLSEALHKTFVKVDEKGTEAAAVTAVVGIEATSIRPGFSFRATRPFIYAIRDMRSGEILFIGRMLDPTSKQLRSK